MRRSIEEEISFTFFGAVGGVTGSCCLVDSGSVGMFVHDAGMFQGRREERSKRGEIFNLIPMRDIFRGIHWLLISHAHIDHTGRIPKIYRDGFAPTTVATNTTATIMEIMLKNSAQIQATERGGPLYDEHDVNKVFRNLRMVDPYEEIHIRSDRRQATVKFLPNGHVVGANSTLVNLNDRNILFTGDIAPPHHSLCGGYLDQEAYPNDPVHVLVVESTNAERKAVSFEEKRADLLNAIQQVWKNHGNPLLPVLSFHRLQEVLEIVVNSKKEGLLPNDCQIIVDAPLGVAITNAFAKLSPDQFSRGYGDNQNYYETYVQSMARFNLLDNATIIGSHEESVRNAAVTAVNHGEKVIVIASGGMLDHGRAKNYIDGPFGSNPDNGVILSCHQVNGTKGEALTHAQCVRHGKLRGARVRKIDGFSSHASGPEIIRYLELYNLSDLSTVYITHGSDPARRTLARMLTDGGYCENIVLPEMRKTYKV